MKDMPLTQQVANGTPTQAASGAPAITRRRFVQGAAAAGALTVAGALAASDVEPAFAKGGHIGVDARPEWEVTQTVCQACPNACAFAAYTVDATLEKTLGNAADPHAAGNLCARGYGFTQSARSAARVKNPLRKKADGTFQTISWDEAITNIGQQLELLSQYDGGDAITLIYDGARRDARMLSTLFMNGLGSGNIYIDDVTYDVIKPEAIAKVIGHHGYYPDVANAGLVLLVDSSMTDVTTPSVVSALGQAKGAGAKVIALDPRKGTLAQFADDWYPANPGTELAVLLAVCQYLVANGQYDKAFVSANVAGFDDWAGAIQEYTPAWAEGVSGIQSYRIEELASLLAGAAPHVAIQYGNGSVGSLAYVNAPETAQVICMLNALLGAYGQAGGALLPYGFDELFASTPGAAMPADEDGAQGTKAALIAAFNPERAATDAGAALALSPATNGSVEALICVDANVAYDYAAVSGVQTALEKMGLFVCISSEMTETAELADYVLPLDSYLECGTLAQPTQGALAAFNAADAVLEHEDGVNSKPLAEIFDALSEASGHEANISAKAAAITDARLAACGLSSEGLSQVGVAEPAPGAVARAASWQTGTWPTASGKIQCWPAVRGTDGPGVYPMWVPPLTESNIAAVVSDDMNLGQEDRMVVALAGKGDPTFHLISGQPTVPGAFGYNTAELMDIAEMYELGSVWVNKSVADAFGISDGQMITLSNGVFSCQARAYLTDRIVPTAMYLPMSFGHQAERQKVAKGVGVNPLMFADATLIGGYGALCTQ